MKKNFIYILITLVCCVMFAGCEKEDERALVVNKSWLTGAKWYDFWDDGLNSYDQMFIFNQDGYGYDCIQKTDILRFTSLNGVGEVIIATCWTFVSLTVIIMNGML
ncbi:MAG: hypothetical protein LUE98_15320 [Tannerellaceae bacterium]|nr:hypothetical protein [Tannerellaceae bacterium]